MLTWFFLYNLGSQLLALPCSVTGRQSSSQARLLDFSFYSPGLSTAVGLSEGKDIILRGMPHKNSLLTALGAEALIKVKP